MSFNELKKGLIVYNYGDIQLKRYDLINKLIEKNGYNSYLEIGVSNRWDCFERIECESKIAVDPDISFKGRGVLSVTSDVFFNYNMQKFDIIFIDGLHEGNQVEKDIENSLKVLKEGGTIVVHDCFPTVEKQATDKESWTLPKDDPNHSYAWLGTTYKGWLKVRSNRDDLDMYVVATDCGCGIIKKGFQKCIEIPDVITWDYFENNYKEALNLISVDEFLKKENLEG